MAFHGAFEIGIQTAHQRCHAPFYITFEKKKEYVSFAKCPGEKQTELSYVWVHLKPVA